MGVEKIAEIARADCKMTHPNAACCDAVTCYSIAIAYLINHPGDNMYVKGKRDGERGGEGGGRGGGEREGWERGGMRLAVMLWHVTRLLLLTLSIILEIICM